MIITCAHVYGTACHKNTSEDWSDNGRQETPTIDAQVEYREESSPLFVLYRKICQCVV